MTEWFAADDMVPHGFCLAWDPTLMVAIILSNGLIATTFTFLSGALVLKALQPRPPLPRVIFLAYAAFIFACAISHVMDDVTLWLPLYRLQALVLAITALVALFAAIMPVSLWLAHGSGPSGGRPDPVRGEPRGDPTGVTATGEACSGDEHLLAPRSVDPNRVGS